MGGCASRPKDLDIAPEAVPEEAPRSPVKAEPEVAAQVSVFCFYGLGVSSLSLSPLFPGAS